jgi:hypothetical protein
VSSNFTNWVIVSSAPVTSNSKVLGDNQTNLTQSGKNQFLVGHRNVHGFPETKGRGRRGTGENPTVPIARF